MAGIKPHLSRPWLTTEGISSEELAAQAAPVCELYRDAPALSSTGVHVVSTDEMSGIQALERKHPTLNMLPGQVERREFEYIRHGTQCLIANFAVASGEIVAPTVGDSRTELDFAAHIEQTIDTDPDVGWVFIVDRLDVHMSETLVRRVADRLGDTQYLGKKQGDGILKSTKTRAIYLSDASHRIRFAYLPKHCSWLNQVEIWFSVLVRRLLKRGSFISTDDLRERILAFITYFNENLAHPYRWVYTGQTK